MKKILLSLAVIFGSLFSVAGYCGEVPSCSDPNVKAQVMEISLNSLRDQLMPMAVMQILHMSPRMAGNPTYAQWDKIRDKDPSIKNVLLAVDSQIADMSPTIVSIRTQGKNSETRTCWCAAILKVANGNTVPITYTAQYTDDGKEIYVEVDDF